MAVCSECRIAGSIKREALVAFNEGKLDRYEELKFKARVQHERCSISGCVCQHWVESDAIRPGVIQYTANG